MAEKLAQRDRDWIEAMFANPKFTDEDISSISGVPLNEIQKRRAQR
ncbi:hypothetical protein [Fibrobacter succinogenes]|nr:hypothetical protein [Fibrobacter succinogenes]